MAVPAVFANLAMFPGEDKTFQDTIYQADGVTPQNITGWHVTFTVHSYGDPSNVFITKTVGSGITIPVGTDGVLNISVLNADTVGLNPGQYAYTIERTDSGADAVPTTGLFTLRRRGSLGL